MLNITIVFNDLDWIMKIGKAKIVGKNAGRSLPSKQYPDKKPSVNPSPKIIEAGPKPSPRKKASDLHIPENCSNLHNYLLKNPPKSYKFSGKWPQINCFTSNSQFGDKIIRILAEGLGLETHTALSGPKPGLNIIFGMLRGADVLLKECFKKQMDFLFIDHAYFNQGHKLRRPAYRMTLNSMQQTRFRKYPDDRFLETGIRLKPWRTGGEYILVCPPSESVMNIYGCWDWLTETLDELRKFTCSPVRIRHKPSGIRIDLSKGFAVPYQNEDVNQTPTGLDEDLSGARAVVCHTSSVGIRAAIEGVPVICSKYSAAINLGTDRMDLIENLPRPDRMPHLHNLAYSQFYLDEIATGYFWPFL